MIRNIHCRSANRTTALVIFTGEATEDLDTIAREALQIAKAAPAPRKEPYEISGFKGFTYFSTMTNSSGVHMNLEMSIVRTDPQHVVSASLLMADTVAKPDETNARMVKNGLKLKAAE